MQDFHNIRLPIRLAFGSGAGIERKSDITGLSSGFERRSSPWAMGRRRYLIGQGIRSLVDASELLAFFEAREGRLFGFRFKDFSDFKSCKLNQTPTFNDQILGVGDGVNKNFQLIKAYGAVMRPITKPESGSVDIAVNGHKRENGLEINELTGLVSFDIAPAMGAVISAGFMFDVPVRFESDRIELTLEGFEAGRVAAVSLIEIK